MDNQLLDLPISFFEYDRQWNSFTNVPSQQTTLRRIINTKYYRPVIEAIRAEPEKAKQDKLKKQLPAITPVTLLHHRKRNTSFPEKIDQQWPMLMGDIDRKDNPGIDMAELKRHLARLPYVLLCAYSVRGGLWFVVRLPDAQTPETLTAHFGYLKRIFTEFFGITLDSSKGGNPTDLRYVSYDPDPYINENATILLGTYTEPVPLYMPARRTSREGNVQGDINADELERVYGQAILSDLVGEPLLRDGQVTRLFDTTAHSAEKFYTGGKNGKPTIHNYSTGKSWFPINAYREKHGLSYPEAINELAHFYGGIQPQQDKKLLPTAKAPIRGLAVGSNPPLSKKASQPDQRPVVTHVADWKPGTILRPDELQIKRLTVEPSDSYPTEWDTPSPPDEVPTIRLLTLFEWQQQHPPFNATGMASLTHSA